MKNITDIQNELRAKGTPEAAIEEMARMVYDMAMKAKAEDAPMPKTYFSLVDENNRNSLMSRIKDALEGTSGFVDAWKGEKSGSRSFGEAGLSVKTSKWASNGDVGFSLAGSKMAWTFSPELTLKAVKAAQERLEKSAEVCDRLETVLTQIIQEGKI